MRDWILPNSVIQYPGKEEGTSEFFRVLYVDHTQTEAALFALHLETTWPCPRTIDNIVADLNTKKALVCPVDPFPAIADDSKIKPEHLKMRNENWGLIIDLVQVEPDIYLEKERARLIKQVSFDKNVGRKRLYEALRRFWRYGMVPNSQIPNYRNCGKTGKRKKPGDAKWGRPSQTAITTGDHKGLNITPLTIETIKFVLENYFKKGPGAYKKCYIKMLEEHFCVKFEDKDIPPRLIPPGNYPSYRQFMYWKNKLLNPDEQAKKELGMHKYNLITRPLHERTTFYAFGPGHIYQIDSTIADIWLVLSLFEMRQWLIGRPVIYIVVDVFSKMVVGFYVGLQGPDYIGAVLALANAASDKLIFARDLGITFTSHLPEGCRLPRQLVPDRAELFGPMSDSLTNTLNILVTNTPVGRADFKGIVERTFGRWNEDFILWQPGAVKQRIEEYDTRESHYRYRAVFSLRKFTELLFLMINKYNNYNYMKDYPLTPEMIAAGVNPVPSELWRYGIENRSGRLTKRSEEEVVLKLLPRKTGSFSREGLRVLGRDYESPEAQRLGWHAKAKRSGNFPLEVAYSPRRDDTVLALPQNGPPITFKKKEDNAYHCNTFEEEYLEYEACKSVREDSHKHPSLQAEIDYNFEIEKIRKEEEKKTAIAREQYGPVSESLLSNMVRPARNFEIEAQGQLSVIDPQGTPLILPSSIQHEISNSSLVALRDVTGLSNQKRLLELLKPGGRNES